MESKDYTKSPIDKLVELAEKSEHENLIVKKRLDTHSAERFSDRQEKRSDNINNIGIWLMWFGGIMLTLFVLLTFASGLFSSYLPETTGFQALSDLFSAIVINSKTIILILLGYFFRDYATEIVTHVRSR